MVLQLSFRKIEQKRFFNLAGKADFPIGINAHKVVSRRAHNICTYGQPSNI